MNFYKAFFLEKEIKSLDGLRAMACLMVIIAHLVEVHGSGLNSYLQQALDLGKEGVAFFFTISGFIITYLLLREKKSKDTIKIKKFVLRRSIKIIPVLYLFLIFLVILNQLNFVKIHPDNFLSSFLFFRNYSNAPYSAFTGHVWSLAVEEHFYFFWPAIILFLNKKHLFYFAIFVILISPLIRVGTFYYFPELHVRQDIMTHCRIDSFMFGALLAMAYFEDKLKWLNSKIKHPALTLWCLIIFYCLIHPTLKMHSFKGYLILVGISLNALVSSIIIAILITNKNNLFYKLFNSKAAIHLGIISYSLYIWQQFSIYFFSNILLAICCSYIFGLISFIVVEQTFERIKKKILVEHKAV